MKYLVTKIKLKNINKQLIHQIIVNLHQIEEDYSQYITYINKGWIIQYKDILAYHIEDDWIYEYIFNDKEKVLYINLDDQGYSEYIDILEYLLKKDYILKEEILYVDKKAFYIESFEELNTYHYQLPIIYLNHSLSNDEEFVSELASKVVGMAYVVYGNEEFEKKMKTHYHIRDSSYLIYLNHHCIKLSSLKHESNHQFIERIFLKVQNYITTRVYEYPYSMSQLYKNVLNEMIAYEKENENIILSDLEMEMMSLEEEKEKLVENISKLNTYISLLEEKNKSNLHYLEDLGEYPLLLKGDEKEYYLGEQKDMILYLLEESKNGKDQEYKDMIDKIISDNPKVGIRDELIENIQKTLKAMPGVTDRAIAKLKKYGVYLEKNDHYAARFFEDSRYLITVASSSSDVQFANQVRRHVKKYFF